MGFWDSLLGEEETGQKTGKPTANPFAVSLKLHPLRLSAHKKNSINLNVKVKNISPDNHLVSVDALLPKNSMLGFDESAINKGVEKRIGELKAGESMEIALPIWANRSTEDGKFDVEVTVFAHYIGYEKVLSYLKKKTSFRVVE